MEKRPRKRLRYPKSPCQSPEAKSERLRLKWLKMKRFPPLTQRLHRRMLKRRSAGVRANAAWEVLQKAKIPGLQLPNQLNGRISFTCRDPNGQGIIGGCDLGFREFFTSQRRGRAAEWPTTCTHLKVGYMLGLHVWWQCQPLRPMFFDP